MDIGATARDVLVILLCLTTITGILYWVLKAKIKEDVLQNYCVKEDCDKKHEALDKDILASKNDFKEEFHELKETVNEIRKMLFDFISKK